MPSCQALDGRLSSAKAKRLVALVAARTDELDYLGHECGHANANDCHRPGIDLRVFAVAQLAPDARKGLLDIGFVARRVFERRIENRFHGEVLMCVATS